jgi:hypothetical protein
MNPFRDVFLGFDKRTYTRAARACRLRRTANSFLHGHYRFDAILGHPTSG